MHIDLHPQLIHLDETIRVEIDENAKYIYLEWLKTPSSEEFRQAFYRAGALSLEHHCEYWLSDAQQIPFLEFGDQNWVLREMKPLLVTSSLKKFARLSSKESMSLLDIHRIYSSLINEGLGLKTEFESFTNRAAALDWLFSEYDKELSSPEKQ